jgi:YVTN family beta-propeller protein
VTAVCGAAVVGAALLLVPSGTAIAQGPVRVLGYIANNGGGVSVLDTATNTVTSTLVDSNGDSPYGVGVAFDGARGYVTNVRDDTLTVIDTPTNTIDAAVPVGDGPAGVVVSPSGGHVYVSNYLAGTVSVVDTVTNTEIADIPTGNTPTAVAVTPNGAKLVVVNKFSNDVAVVDTASNAVIGKVPVSVIPHGVAISPDGARAYVTNSEGHSLSVVDIAALTTVAQIPVGSRPISVALSPDGSTAYVTESHTGRSGGGQADRVPHRQGASALHRDHELRGQGAVRRERPAVGGPRNALAGLHGELRGRPHARPFRGTRPDRSALTNALAMSLA